MATAAACPMCRSAHTRLGSLRPLESLRAAQKRQHGRHPEYGRLTIPQMLAHWAEHDLSHIEQIRAAHRQLSRRGGPGGGRT